MSEIKTNKQRVAYLDRINVDQVMKAAGVI